MKLYRDNNYTKFNGKIVLNTRIATIYGIIYVNVNYSKYNLNDLFILDVVNKNNINKSFICINLDTDINDLDTNINNNNEKHLLGKKYYNIINNTRINLEDNIILNKRHLNLDKYFDSSNISKISRDFLTVYEEII